MFLTICLTVFLLLYLANQQMAVHFTEYLSVQHMTMMQDGVMGLPEQIFIESIHRSLYWVGAAILLVGLLASYAVAQSITVPIRKLGAAVDAVRQGQYGQKVDVVSDDEVGKVASAFNEMSQSLADSVRIRQQFLADIAHELKTPLAVIQGNLEGMLEGVVSTSEEQLTSLYEETVYLNRMIKDLRDVTLAETGQLELEKEAADINLLLSRAMNMLEPLAEEKEILLVKHLQPVPSVFVDVRRMNQVIYNLLTNALRYVAAKGVITVSSRTIFRQGREWVRIDVADTGCGISAEDLPFVFEHFYRADKSRDKASGGSGIGLAIVKQLVEIHGGLAEAASTPGQGSCFSVSLPLESGLR